MNGATDLKTDTRGSTFLEYIVLCGLVGLVGLSVYGGLGKAVWDKIEEIADRVASR